MNNFTFTCDTLPPLPSTAAAAAVPTVPAKNIQVIRPSDRRQAFGPNDADLQAAVMALSGPVFNAPGWNGPSLSKFAERGRNVQARFDNAQYDQGMRKHWANADYLGPDAAANPGVHTSSASAPATKSPTTRMPGASSPRSQTTRSAAGHGCT